ncbi:type IV pilus assembly protein PilM [Vibrio renipiscarius]|uniref:Pilus assembly protein PilM n=1 Tax=Vibrio renipiscarius TaxID=1461322 RepID=A0A0C2NPU5_9VIBR|nr:type IV pilus assembly protein PilM [Vibrio renipiscarius]KII77717.1 pilus assembly protein PilM [Vibrio renipiscarius]KII81541.1 pilus assembly protein PilM [Vibrio renipiscarius]
MSFSLITGVDIGHYSIKAVVLKPVKGTLTLSGYRELVIEESIFSDNHLLSYQEIVNKLKELRKGLPFFSHKVALSLPDNSVISKVLHVEKGLTPQERDYAIIEAFSHQSPFDLDELCLDYCDLSNEAGSSQGVQVYATKKEVVENRMSVCRKAGFRPVLFDVHAHSLVRLWQAVSQKQSRSNWLLLDVGHHHSSMVMDFANKAPFAKDLPIGISSMLASSEEPSALHHDVTHQFIQSLVERIQRHLHLIESMDSSKLEGIWLTGGGANTPALADELAQRLNLKCELLDPLSLFENKNSRKKASHACGYSFSSSVGLALLGQDWMGRRHAS